MKRLVILACALVAVACAQQQQVARTQPGLWQDWRAMAVNQMTLIPQDRSIPEELRWALINCAVDTSLEFYTPDELRRLNSHANGAAFMSDAELNAVDAKLKTRVDAEGGLDWQMNKRCPDTLEQVAAIKG